MTHRAIPTVASQKSSPSNLKSLGEILIEKVVKTCCALQNENAAVERSLSDNKNTVMKERTRLNQSTIMGTQIIKELVRYAGGPHNVVITAPIRGWCLITKI